MKLRFFVPFLALILGATACSPGEKYQTKEATDANGYTYSYVTNDPQQVKIYTLDNGLKVYLSENKDEPRIKTQITVRAGSTYDPIETTGLAHYFEHLMFKGTQNFGTSDWEKEKVLLDEITELFEQHKNETDPEKKKAIYKKIDEVSFEASKLAIPNEYDKMVSAIGASGTNAYTSFEQTSYVNEVPSNELERWLNMEYERFDTPVLRLFHTELETVYEEYNMSQDRDGTRQFFSMLNGLFPNHPLGIAILGFPEHLKNPSVKNIYQFFNTWYVPNNMAIVLSGDIDSEKTIKLIDDIWGKKEPKELPTLDLPTPTPITKVVEKNVTGPDAESIMFGYRVGGEHSKDKLYVSLIDYILANSTAGLIDINLNQKQEVLYGGCGTMFFNEYGLHYFIGRPKQGQSLEEVRDLLLSQIEKVKKGEFEDWMLEAAINDMQLTSIRSNEGNERVSQMNDAFVSQKDYADVLRFYDDMRNLTKEELMAFAKENYNDNYVVVYKHTGTADELVRMEKPSITPIQINRDIQSEYMQNYLTQTSENIAPVFVDFDKSIRKEAINDNVELNYIANTTNELFELNYIVEMGKYHDLKLPLAVNFVPYLGTNKYTAEELQKEFYKLGISMNVQTGSERSYLTISGLSRNMEKGIELLEHVLANIKPDKEAYDKYVAQILKGRNDNKLNPRAVQSALISYGKYGANSPQTYLIPANELSQIDPNELTQRIKDIMSYPHRVFYYGSQSMDEVKRMLAAHHPTVAEYKSIPEAVDFQEKPTNQKDILFTNYDKSQVDVIFLSKSEKYSTDFSLQSRLFNAYYGSGMNSVIFQEIREARALAYSAFAYFGKPSKPENSFYLLGGVFTQADKMMTAVSTMDDLLNNMIRNDKSFSLARQSILKNIETQRIIKDDIFWTWLSNQKMGINHDTRKELYEYTQNASLDDVDKFFNQYVKNSDYTYVISGKKENLDMNAIKKQGNVKELSLEEIFGY